MYVFLVKCYENQPYQQKSPPYWDVRNSGVTGSRFRTVIMFLSNVMLGLNNNEMYKTEILISDRIAFWTVSSI